MKKQKTCKKKGRWTWATKQRAQRGAGGAEAKRKNTAIVAAGDGGERGCREEERRRANQKVYILRSLGIFAGSHAGIYSGKVVAGGMVGAVAAIRE